MSADNYIGIAKLEDGKFKVFMDFDSSYDAYTLEAAKRSKGKIVNTLREADEEAIRMLSDCDIVEYGLVSIGFDGSETVPKEKTVLARKLRNNWNRKAEKLKKNKATKENMAEARILKDCAKELHDTVIKEKSW